MKIKINSNGEIDQIVLFPKDGFDYYITDDLGGVHTDGVGYAPDGTFCGECTRESCVGCPAWEKEN